MLFHCKYAKKIWGETEFILNRQLSIENVIFGTSLTLATNTVVSLICHFIYKEWLSLSLEGKTRSNIQGLKAFKYDFIFQSF